MFVVLDVAQQSVLGHVSGSHRITQSIAVTIDDPKAYTKPWVGKPIRFSMRPRVEIGEWYCTIEDETRFNQKIRFPTFVCEGDKK